jgi:pyrroloquinoline quinone biosynthesis protein D
MRCAMGDAGCTLPRLCGAKAYSARRLRAEGLEHPLSDPSELIAPEARPRLPRGVRLVHNEAQGGWVLLAPERIFKADAIAAEIIKRCTGEVTFGELVDDLAKRYAAPREKILADVGTLLRGLADKKLLEL